MRAYLNRSKGPMDLILWTGVQNFSSGGWRPSPGQSGGIPQFEMAPESFQGVRCYSWTHRTEHQREVFYNPYSTYWLADNNPSAYAHLPGKLSLNQIDHCAPYDSRLLSRDVFSTKDDALDPDSPSFPGNSYPVCVRWQTRCMRTADHPLMDEEFFALVIAWLQRHRNTRIWAFCLKIVPVSIMRDLSTMQFLFHKNCNAKVLLLDTSSSLFHPVIDIALFMDASIPVMCIILESKDLFIKPYIAFLAEEYMAHLWTCLISFNGGQIGVDQPKEKEHVCGYLHFSPIS